jgi:GMP synthase (glutamine-hydrolysing)
MRNALVIRHVAFEDLGTLAPALGRQGYRIRYVEPGALGGVAVLQPRLLLVLGGPIGACDDARYPWLAEEAALLKQRIEAGRPTLGICLGAQLIARALGARVYAAQRREIGYGPVELTPAGRGSALRHLDSPATPVLHWHGDTFDLPERAALLASTEVCANQAFSIGERILGLQFHPEFEGAALERWLVGHTVELGLAGVDPNSLRDQARRFGPALERRAARLWDQWLEGLDA